MRIRIYLICTFRRLDIVLSDPFMASVPIISTSEQQKEHLWFSGVLKGCGVEAVARNRASH